MGKKRFFTKTMVGLTAVAVGAKVAYDKYKIVKDRFEKEENDSLYEEIKKYNAVCTNKIVEVEDDAFAGCEVKTIASKLILDLSLAVFEKDVYINFKSDMSIVKVILPEGVNVTCDIESKASRVHNTVENSAEDGISTVYIIGTAKASNIDVFSAEFYTDDDDDFEDEIDEADEDGEMTGRKDSEEKDSDEEEI